MLIGVISDSHDRMPAIRKAIDMFKDAGVDRIIHAGDIIAPFALKAFLNSGIPFIGVLGNNDGEKAGLQRLTPELKEPPVTVELEGVKIVVVHSPDELPEDLSGAEVLIHGHTHEPEVRKDEEGRLVINPGESCGWVNGVCRAGLLVLPEKEYKPLVLMKDEE